MAGTVQRPVELAVLREHATGSDLLTWGEFIEAGFLNEYRLVQRIPLPEIRAYIDAWRKKLGVPYPLAHQQPYAGPGRHLMDVAETGEGDTVIYRLHDGHLTFTPWAQEFVRKVEFDHNVASRHWPAGRDQPVVIDPKRSFGAPTVEGIRTEVLSATGHHRPPPRDDEQVQYASNRCLSIWDNGQRRTRIIPARKAPAAHPNTRSPSHTTHGIRSDVPEGTTRMDDPLFVELD